MTQIRTPQRMTSETLDAEVSFTQEHRTEIQRAQATWSETPLRQRVKVIRHLRHLIVENDYGLAGAVQRHRGVSLAEVMAAEIVTVVEACDFLEREAKSILKPRKLGRNGRPIWLGEVWSEVHREPFGIVLVIGPSNYPFFLPACHMLQALVAGNAVLVKPGKGGSEALLRLASLAYEAGLDDNLLTILPETTASVEATMETGVDKVVLTGSANTGRILLGMAAEHTVPVVAELSGCDAAFVIASASLDRVVKALTFSLRWNRSETCIAARRVFVARSVADELERRLADSVEKLNEDWEPHPASARAIPLIREALERGARPITDDIVLDESGIKATVLADVPADCALLREDVFAPVMSLVSVDSMDEALTLARQCPYALGATIFGNEGEARALAHRVNAGSVLVNDIIVPTGDPRMPFGGRGKSGFGVTRGAEGLLEMTTVKIICRRRGTCRHLEEPHPTDAELFHRYLQMYHGSNAWERFWAGMGFIKFLWKRATGRSVVERKE